MVKVGVHVSIAGSIDQAVDRAKAKGCDVFQMFSRNPRGWSFRPLNPDEITAFAKKISATGLLPVDHICDRIAPLVQTFLIFYKNFLSII